ncbi:MAG TPA: hypothetical protein PLI09_29015 [Candidatus Hydrogenedentes bacterium]|nr:hypothetical protein [Candidatus Hydrogenedentota bacterium]
MRRFEMKRKIIVVSLLLVIPLFAQSRLAGAESDAPLHAKMWTWGYVITGTPPGDVPFVGKSTCSLETGAQLLGTPNVVFMNSAHDGKTLTAEYLAPIASYKKVVCALQHGAYADTARKVSAMSLEHSNIIGGLIDDFRDPLGPSKAITPEETKAIYDALKSKNQALRLYVVRYTHQDPTELIPFLPYFDVINLWVWVAGETPWREEIDAKIDQIKQQLNKPVLLGLFMHDYGGTGKATAMNVLELQTRKAVELTQGGKIEGFVVLQSGWFHHEDHQPQVQWIKGYLESVK